MYKVMIKTINGTYEIAKIIIKNSYDEKVLLKSYEKNSD